MTTKRDDGGPAFHSITIRQEGDPAYNRPTHYYHRGMSLRDWFAGMALQGHIASDTEDFHCNEEVHARYAYKMADAMLVERNKAKD